jgi:hypothetical protein
VQSHLRTCVLNYTTQTLRSVFIIQDLIPLVALVIVRPTAVVFLIRESLSRNSFGVDWETTVFLYPYRLAKLLVYTVVVPTFLQLASLITLR